MGRESHTDMVEGNIGAVEQRKRRIAGLAALALGLAAVLMARPTGAIWWIILFSLFWFGALGLFQAREKT